MPKRTTAPSRGREGFTIVELMVVAAIIGIMAAAVVPSLTAARADGRQSDAAQELLRLARRARSHMLETGAAHMLRYRQADSFGLGRVTLFTGMTNKCRHTPWVQALEGVPPLGVSSGLLSGADIVDMSQFNPKGDPTEPPKSTDLGRHVITLRAGGTFGGTMEYFSELYLCFEPSGASYTGIYYGAGKAAGVEPNLQVQTTPMVFSIVRTYGSGDYTSNKVGVNREVVFVPGGNARVRR